MKNVDEFAQVVGTLDVETRGLDGDIVLAAVYYSGEVRYAEDAEALRLILEQIQPAVLYVHNLEFDLRKLLKRWGVAVDWRGGHLLVSGRVARCQLADYDVELRDSWQLLRGSLRRLAEDWGVGEKGVLPDMDVVSASDVALREYLADDVRILYRLVRKVFDLSGLELEVFLRAYTTAGLGLRLYETLERGAVAYLRTSGLEPARDGIFRRAYYGGRAEVFVPHLRAPAGGYHYDVNSLYPTVMRDESYPVGELRETAYGPEIFDRYCRGVEKVWGIAEADVDCPLDMAYPVLPWRRGDKLVFPVGRFAGAWTLLELRAAWEAGYVIHIRRAWVTTKGAKIFASFVARWEGIKNGSTGEKREFAKLILNSLGGKFGQSRERLSYMAHSEAAEERERRAGRYVTTLRVLSTANMIVAKRRTYAYFLRVEIAAYITAYARLRMHALLERARRRNAVVYYMDTDSLVVDKPLPTSMVHPTEFGLLKLVRRVREGIYLQPKLYAERARSGDVLRGRGIASEYLASEQFTRYEEWLARLKAGEREIAVYGVDAGYWRYYRLVSALDLGDAEARRSLRYTIRVAAGERRSVDYAANGSRAVDATHLRPDTRGTRVPPVRAALLQSRGVRGLVSPSG